VILLTAKGEESDRVIGLRLGADDYVVKPFSPAELVARVDAVLRRIDTPPEPGGADRARDMTIDPAAGRCSSAARRSSSPSASSSCCCSWPVTPARCSPASS
jgi:two-component system response regulator ResD